MCRNAPPEALLTTPPHSLTDKLADLKDFLSARRAQQGKARNGNRTPCYESRFSLRCFSLMNNYPGGSLNAGLTKLLRYTK